MKVSFLVTQVLRAGNIISHYTSTQEQQLSQRPLQDVSNDQLTDHRPNPIWAGGMNLYYLTNLYMGTPPQLFEAILDFGSSILVVPSIIQDNPARPQTKHQYDSSKSTTYHPNGTLFHSDPNEIQPSSGFLSQDNFQMSDLVIKDMFFEEATTIEVERCTVCWVGDTVLPLGPYNASNPLNFMSPIAQFIEQNLLDENLFSLLLSRGETDNPGQLVLGGLVNEEFYEGEFIEIPTTSLPVPPNSSGTFPESWLKGEVWKVEAQSLLLGNETLLEYKFKEPTVAVIEAVYPWIYIPEKVAHEINVLLGAEFWGPLAWVDCTKRAQFPDITLVLAGQKFVLTAYDYLIEQLYDDEPGVLYCMSSFGLGSEEDDGLIILGTAFLKAWVSVYNLDGESVAFARAKHGPPNE